VSDEEAAAAGWDALWDPNHAGEIVLYDSYGDTIAVTILRNGSLDVNTGDPALITAAKESILETINENQAALKIKAYAKLPASDYTVGEAWSGDIVGAQWYLPKGSAPMLGSGGRRRDRP
jgi:spermidine/putrescine transport system substrate-binding protein